jgi:hypothetical protein
VLPNELRVTYIVSGINFVFYYYYIKKAQFIWRTFHGNMKMADSSELTVPVRFPGFRVYNNSDVQMAAQCGGHVYTLRLVLPSMKNFIKVHKMYLQSVVIHSANGGKGGM